MCISQDAHLQESRSETNVCYGWGDFPVMTLEEAHPSTLMMNKIKSSLSEGTVAKKDVLSVSITDAIEHSEKKFISANVGQQHIKIHRSEPIHTDQFSWSDYPVVLDPSRRSKKKVSFATVVHIREHTITLGDHPLCSGFPLALDWSHRDEVVGPLKIERATLSTPSNTSSYRVDVLERRSRLALAMNLSTDQVDEFERQRKQRETDTIPFATSALVRIPTLPALQAQPNESPRIEVESHSRRWDYSKTCHGKQAMCSCEMEGSTGQKACEILYT